MACPICDQKPANCDCTETERRQWSEINDLRLTDEEREAIEVSVQNADEFNTNNAIIYVGVLRGLLERLA